MVAHTNLHMSPAQAAQAAGVSRWTIMRAIKSHDLPAHRDNRNQWKITAEDLRDWRSHTVRTLDEMHTSHTTEEELELRAKLAAETVRADSAERAREQAEADRDRWHEAYREATQKGDPVLPVAFTVMLAASLTTLVSGVTTKEPLLGWLLIFLGGCLLVMSVAIADRIRRQSRKYGVQRKQQ